MCTGSGSSVADKTLRSGPRQSCGPSGYAGFGQSRQARANSAGGRACGTGLLAAMCCMAKRAAQVHTSASLRAALVLHPPASMIRGSVVWAVIHFRMFCCGLACREAVRRFEAQHASTPRGLMHCIWQPTHPPHRPTFCDIACGRRVWGPWCVRGLQGLRLSSDAAVLETAGAMHAMLSVVK